MKLLIYSHAFAPNVGGVETSLLLLARGLAGLRNSSGAPEFEVTFATQTPAKGYDDSVLPYRVVRQPGAATLWWLIRDSDVVHVAGPALMPLFLAWLSRKPYVIEHHVYQAVCPQGLFIHHPERSVCPGHFQAGNYRECQRCLAHELSYFRTWVNLLLMFPRHFLATRASSNIAITGHVLTRCGLPRSSVHYYGIDDAFRGESSPKDNTAFSPVTSFFCVGRFVPEKGIPVLLAAARLLADEGLPLDIYLVGDGPERTKIEEIIVRDRLQSCVIITGFLTGAALAETLRDARIVVMPSLCEETAGLSAIEQMMRGRLVIASDIGGLGEVVGDSGLKCPPGDTRALADAMRSVILNPTLIDSFGKRARERALRLFAVENMVAEHAHLYRDLLHIPQQE